MANVEMGRDYTLLAETLMTYPFGDGVMVGNDENRAVDGLSLRDEFESSYGELDISTDEPCSMLEMMVALAIRAADLMYDSGCPDTPKYYFDVMIGNLGLEKMTNFAINQAEICATLTNFAERRAGTAGTKLLWKVKNPPKNMNEVEIWSQMQWFLTEIYFKNTKN